MAKELKEGFFLCFEGPEGSGKSTHSRKLAEELRASGVEVEHTFEPGATAVGRKIRNLLLEDETVELVAEAELLLFEADRAQHVRGTIVPALKEGKVVICDRYSLATLAYQGGGLGLPVEELIRIDRFATAGREPDITVVLDVDVSTGLKRASGGETADKMERRDLEFHHRVREAYLKMASERPDDIKVISAEDEVDLTYVKIRRILDEKLGRYLGTG